jgi:hypothetical protein
VTYVAKWAPKNMNYTVEYYQEKLDGGYEIAESHTFPGETNSHVDAEEKSFSGFTLDKTVE